MGGPEIAIQYLGGDLDRVAERRDDERWLDEQMTGGNSLVVPVCGSRNLVKSRQQENGLPRAVLLGGEAAANVFEIAREIAFLGVRGDRAVFAAETPTEGSIPGATGKFVDLRSVGQLMEQRDAALLAYARGLMHWHRSHRHCPRCGHPTKSRQGGHVRACVNDPCGRESYPRTDPAVIMLVEDAPPPGQPKRCLLGRRPDWPVGVFSTLAGFVEPGESLEEAVTREVMEEAGVPVSDVRYQASQPWPFPSSLMLGFFARAARRNLTIDREELQEAGWFTAAELREAGEWHGDAAGLRLPRRDSIARYLIETWLSGERT